MSTQYKVVTKMSKTLQRRSIVLMLDLDEKTADDIVDGVISFITLNYKIHRSKIETNKRTTFVRNYVEVENEDEKREKK